MSVFYTGDIHRHIGRIVDFITAHKVNHSDTIVIMGDAGFNLFLDGKRDESLKSEMNKYNVPILCVHGNHEERPYNVKGYHLVDWKGGKVYIQDKYPNLLFAKDGEMYDLDGKKSIVIGGAFSVNRVMYGSTASCFDSEQPNDEIKRYVEEQLEKHNWSVDQVLTHTCPVDYRPFEAFLSNVDQSRVDISTEIWLGSLENKLKYTRWICGHYHIDKTVNRVRFISDDFII